VTPYSVVVGYPEDGGNMDLRNVGILPQHYMTSQPRRTRLESSLPWNHSNLANCSSVCTYVRKPFFVSLKAVYIVIHANYWRLKNIQLNHNTFMTREMQERNYSLMRICYLGKQDSFLLLFQTVLSYTEIYEAVSKSFRAESITKYTLTFYITRREATRRVMAAKLTRLTHKIAI